MTEYLFMYALAFIAVLFAVVQDVRTREIANWLTFSLIAFVLAYRVIYSIYSQDFMFFVYGFIGILFFTVLGYLFYYSKIFAGGDAKLLFGIGGIFPYQSLTDYALYGLGFIFALFTFGVIYTLIYSLFLARRNYPQFRKSFVKSLNKIKLYFVFSFVAGVMAYSFLELNYLGRVLFSLFIICLPVLFSYVKAIESSCMIKFVTPDKLTEGDWLERDVIVNGKTIRKNFAGMTYEQILLLRKFGKKVWVKNGVPFAPAFLLAFLFFFYLLRNSSW